MAALIELHCRTCCLTFLPTPTAKRVLGRTRKTASRVESSHDHSTSSNRLIVVEKSLPDAEVETRISNWVTGRGQPDSPPYHVWDRCAAN